MQENWNTLANHRKEEVLRVKLIVECDIELCDPREGETFNQAEADLVGRMAIKYALRNAQLNGFDHPDSASTSIEVVSVSNA